MDNAKIEKGDVFFSLPCNHYEFELKKCSNFSDKIFKTFYAEESSIQECSTYQHLFIDCLKYHRDHTKNVSLLVNLYNYEKKIVEARLETIRNNDVWELRKNPPIDWNSELPIWASKKIKNTYWYKSSNKQKD